MPQARNMPDLFSLLGRNALVTGGATGIGQAIALALAEAGADVAITVHQRGGEQTISAIKGAGRMGHAIAADLQSLDPAGAEELVATASGLLGDVDILINNAGIIRRADALDFEEADWRQVLATNLDAVWFLSQAAGRRMAAKKGGAIVSIASLLSFQGGIRVPAYTAAKHAVVGITRALGNELAAANVRVNAIAPGYIATQNTEALRADETRNRQILERIPAGRWGDPRHIAGAAVFLASEAAAYMSGSVVTVDGGWMAR